MASQNKDILLEGHPSVVVAIEEREELCMILFFLHLTSILYMIETVDMQPQFDNIVLASTTVIFPLIYSSVSKRPRMSEQQLSCD